MRFQVSGAPPANLAYKRCLILSENHSPPGLLSYLHLLPYAYDQTWADLMRALPVLLQSKPAMITHLIKKAGWAQDI